MKLVFAVFTGLFAVGAIGGGDVKLISAVSLWAGPQGIILLLLVTTVAGGLLGLAILVQHNMKSGQGSPVKNQPTGKVNALKESLAKPIPYGIAIAAGGLFVAEQVLRQGLS